MNGYNELPDGGSFAQQPQSTGLDATSAQRSQVALSPAINPAIYDMPLGNKGPK